ncbi:recombination protein RecR [Candidatus Parcubacteria bacterium]|nr:recombination protein RecR [Candidatus Parcubacteria bacterium]
MRKFPEPITNLVAAFSQLPGVGPKTALRYVFFLLTRPQADLQTMARAIVNLGAQINVCPRCFTYTQRTMCEMCEDPKRDGSFLCVVEEPRDISTIEATDSYHGLYHVLGGTLNPIEGMTPDTLRVKELYARVHADPTVREVILALSPTVHGEMTMLYLHKQLAPLGRRVSRLARGLPVGSTLEFADEISLGDALSGRREMHGDL